jgi:uncharacterized protein YciI
MGGDPRGVRGGGGRGGMKYVLLYESADDVASRAPEHFPAHRQRIDEFHRRGDILMVGTFADPQKQGSMAIFPTRESAEEFVAGDPFVKHGVVRRYELREWREILTSSAAPGAAGNGSVCDKSDE